MDDMQSAGGDKKRWELRCSKLGSVGVAEKVRSRVSLCAERGEGVCEGRLKRDTAEKSE